MRIIPKLLLLLVLGVLSKSAFAQEALHKIALKSGTAFELISGNQLAIFPLSERTKELIQKGRNRPIIAADYTSGTVIKTTQPKTAVQEILRQISEQTALSLGSFSNSVLTAAEPSVILMAAGETSVWTIILTPKEADTYVLSVTYLFDEKKRP